MGPLLHWPPPSPTVCCGLLPASSAQHLRVGSPRSRDVGMEVPSNEPTWSWTRNLDYPAEAPSWLDALHLYLLCLLNSTTVLESTFIGWPLVHQESLYSTSHVTSGPPLHLTTHLLAGHWCAKILVWGWRGPLFQSWGAVSSNLHLQSLKEDPCPVGPACYSACT